MFSIFTRFIIIPTLLAAYASAAFPEVVFSDSFESGDLSKTNAYGFSWSAPNKTSIVTMSPECKNNDNSPTIIYNGDNVCIGPIPGKFWRAHIGKNSLRFNYPAGEEWTEQRFNLGSPLNDMWISFWLRVPYNFKYGTAGGPNKLLALWMDGYSQHGNGSTVWLTMWPHNSVNAGVSFTYSRGGYTSSTSMQQFSPFISTDDSGKWMRLIVHVKAETTPGNGDGILQTFRQWQGSEIIEQIHDGKNLAISIPENGPNGFQRGYLLGWANATYSEDTDWLIDDFIISSTPLISGPKPASDLSIE